MKMGEWRMSRIVRATRKRNLATALLAAAWSSLSSNASAGLISWSCWDNLDLTIHCIRDHAREGAASIDRVGDQEGKLIEARLPSHYPAVARVIRLEPNSLGGITVAIPLLAPASDNAFAKELAESVMCGMRLACVVTYADAPPRSGNVAVARR